MSASRPDPDALLARVKREESRAGRGRLRVFFGACAGVGKTYAMLTAARAEKARGTNVVIGMVVTHGRSETAMLAEGIERLPLREFERQGAMLSEFDLDAALARKPALMLVDELAHTNAPGSRHPKRWQDVEELIAAGIDVYTSLNVQHLESVNDVVGQITGVRVWETLPDKVFEQADEVELVDLPPDDLLERLGRGKVYIPEQATRAADNFFRKGNLIALRELALRRTAERVDAQMRDYRDEKGIRAAWPVTERLLVAIGPGEDGEHLVRTTRRMASSMGAEWTALYVETPALLRLPEAERDRVLRTLRLAEELGAKSVVVGGGDVASEVLGFAHAQNVSRVIIGHSKHSRWRRRLLGSTPERIITGAGDLDVALVGTQGKHAILAAGMIVRSREALGVSSAGRRRWPAYLGAAATPAAISVLGAVMHGSFALPNIAMVFLLGVVVVAIRFGRGPSVLAVVLSVAAFDFFFVPPRFSFAVADTEYLVTFGVMLLVGLVISTLAGRVRLQARIAGYREQRTSALFEMSREMAATEKLEEIVRIAVRHVAEVFASQVVVLLPDANGHVQHPRGNGLAGSLRGADLAIAQWVYDHKQPAGLGTDTLAGSDTHFAPLATPAGPVGVLALLPANARRIFVPEQRRLLDTFAALVAMAIARARLADEARAAQLAAETESLRNALLAAISHELRTPLATIVGASSSLAEQSEAISATARRELAHSVAEEARRMSEVVTKVLDLARLQAGATRVNAGWHTVEEVVGGALSRLTARLTKHKVTTRLPKQAVLVRFDEVLVEQVLVNLVENAAKYTPPGSGIDVAVETRPDEIEFTVVDDGPGLRPGEEKKVFDKFHRGVPESSPGGAGLGLAICKAIVEAHGGRIWAENIPAGGVVFRFSIPQGDEEPPVLEAEIPA
ncbi:MAG: sensor histidine kinase KdpD [Betaproteobacteria bacterium]|nr:sensor histidine kinase KdpD [Betaproteobacteria bacterium]